MMTFLCEHPNPHHMITVCPIPELISDLDGLIPAVKVAGVALCGEVWLKPLMIVVMIDDNCDDQDSGDIAVRLCG